MSTAKPISQQDKFMHKFNAYYDSRRLLSLLLQLQTELAQYNSVKRETMEQLRFLPLPFIAIADHITLDYGGTDPSKIDYNVVDCTVIPNYGPLGGYFKSLNAFLNSKSTGKQAPESGMSKSYNGGNIGDPNTNSDGVLSFANLIPNFINALCNTESMHSIVIRFGYVWKKPAGTQVVYTETGFKQVNDDDDSLLVNRILRNRQPPINHRSSGDQTDDDVQSLSD